MRCGGLHVIRRQLANTGCQVLIALLAGKDSRGSVVSAVASQQEKSRIWISALFVVCETAEVILSLIISLVTETQMVLGQNLGVLSSKDGLKMM